MYKQPPLSICILALASALFVGFSQSAEAQLGESSFQLQQNTDLTTPTAGPVTLLPGHNESPPRARHGLWSIMWSVGASATLGFGVTYWLAGRFDGLGCSDCTTSPAPRGWILAGVTAGVAMFVGGLVGQILGARAHARRLREYHAQQASLVLDPTAW